MSRCVTTQVSVYLKRLVFTLILPVMFSIKAKGFLGLVDQVLAFVTFFSQVKRNIFGLCCCFTKRGPYAFTTATARTVGRRLLKNVFIF